MPKLTATQKKEMYENRAKAIATNIERAIRVSGKTAEDIAYESGLSVNIIYYSRRGISRHKKPYMPRVDTLEKLASSLNTTLDNLTKI